MRTFNVFRSVLTLIFLCGAGFDVLPVAASQNPVVVGHARFTVITPHCIRLEYRTSDTFIDQASIFAMQRRTHFDGFRCSQANGQTVIDTGSIHLTYHDDGSPFSSANLQAVIKNQNRSMTWTPGIKNGGNLGGTLRTLDGVGAAQDLGEGLLSRDGWALIDDSTAPLLTQDWVEDRLAGAETDWYLFGYGHDYHAALRSLTAIGGSVPLPRRYALGAWYSRWWPYSSTDFEQIVNEYRDHNFPLDTLVMDMDWHKDGWTGWSWNKTLIPDPDALLAWMHHQGIHVTVNLHPADGVQPHEDAYPPFMRDMGQDPASPQALPFDVGSKKYMDTLFADVLQPLEQDGIDFWWLDWQQYPNTRSVPTLSNLAWLNHLLYDRTGRNGLRGLSFSRWAGWGDHRHPIHFSGDTSINWPTLAFEVPFTATAGNVGCFFWSHDIGGFGGQPNGELYARWVQFGAFSPVLRSHSSRQPDLDKRPWTYPKWAEDSMRLSFHLRDTLFPYLYSSTAQSCRDTIPLCRPLYVDYPNAEQSYHNAQEYLFGDNFLVAPVVSPGVGPGLVGTQTVWFPPSKTPWFNFLTGEQYGGGSEILASADINEAPVYVRGGVPIPMQPYTPRMATTPLTTLVVRCFPGSEGTLGAFRLYEDDGLTTAYQQGHYATTLLTCLRRKGTVTVRIAPTLGQYRGQPEQRAMSIEFPDTTLGTASLDGKRIAVAYDATTATCRVLIPARSIRRGALLELRNAMPGGFDTLHAQAQFRRAKSLIGDSLPETIPGKTSTTNAITSLLSDGSLPTALRQSLLSIANIGMVQKDESLYYYKGEVHTQFYAPKGSLDNNRITLLSSQKTLSLNGAPLDVSGPSWIRRGVKVFCPEDLSFSIGGQPYLLHPTVQSQLLRPENITDTAKLSASQTEGGTTLEGAVDGVLGGYPNDKSQEWSCGQVKDGWLQLDWDAPQRIDRIVLYDRINLIDQITSGILTFSDGTSIDVGALPNDGQMGSEVPFSAKTVRWLRFTITGAREATQNSGLAEIAVYRSKQ